MSFRSAPASEAIAGAPAWRARGDRGRRDLACEPAARAGAVLEIDLGAIADNWRKLAALAAPAACSAVVKADAYGLGAAPVAHALLAAGCRRFYVATLDEGLALRRALGPEPDIAVFNGAPPGSLPEFAAARLQPVLSEPGQFDEWRRKAGGSDQAPPGPIVQIDTGLARLGLTAQEFSAHLPLLGALPGGLLLSHLACADDPAHPLNPAQRDRFAAARRRLPRFRASLAASSGIFLGAGYHFDEVRPGAALYGVNPVRGRANPLRPVVRLAARILQIRQIDSGESVGYGAAHIMEKPGILATAAIGYADGWPRSLSRRGCGWLAGVRVPLLGRVSMDLAVFDVSAAPPAARRTGNAIELIGEHYGIDDVAADAGTIGYEILAVLGRRLHRVYRNAADEAAAAR